MRLRCTHTTIYTYSEQVSLCHTEVRLTPRNSRNQTLVEHELVIDPLPRTLMARQDFFGNDVTTVSVDRPHHTMGITATSLVESVGTEAIHPALTPSWEIVRHAVKRYKIEKAFAAFQFTLESPRIVLKPAFVKYASASFPAGRPILECAIDLSHRIYTDFKYDRIATTVNTTVEEALRSRVGVCQDFAHVMIACFRSLGLPARYVSGYLETGGNTIGAQGSHAWVSIYCPGFDWIDVDPTNDLLPSNRHVTLAWGRDYSDVPPVKGVALGGGDHSISITVVVTPASVNENSDWMP